MTRINSAIPPKYLTDEHLLAEHREIKRLPVYLNKAILSGNIKCIPSKFTLGHGHVLFFLDKMEFIRWRYSEIYLEAIIRGFNIIKYHSNFQVKMMYCLSIGIHITQVMKKNNCLSLVLSKG